MIGKHSFHIMNEHPAEKRGDQRRAPSSVWLLVDDRPGNATQGIGLATLLNWPYELKTLRFNTLSHLPNPILGRSRLSLNPWQSALLGPPWPEFVIAAGRRLAPIARWIKMRSGNRTKVIQIGRKGGSDTRDLDLVISCGHYRLLQDPRRLEIFMPLTRVTRERLAEAADGWRERFNTLAHPHVALLVGGPTPVHRLDEEIARRLAEDVGAAVKKAGGSLTVVTSRRTPATVV
ncbi:MAG: ELM1/GtrOC1 family putative glycosyltransferase, partial [Nitrospira sp.]